MKKNNYGLGSRCMKKSGKFALKNEAINGHIGLLSVDTLSHRWNYFIDSVAASDSGIKRLEDINFEAVQEYGRELALMVSEHDLSIASAHNYISAINSVMKMATRGIWVSVSPTVDCGIEKRSYIRKLIPASLARELFDPCLVYICNTLGERASVIVQLCRELGLRSKEASLLNAKDAVSELAMNNHITISHGTKGGRPRTIPIVSENQKVALARAVMIQGKDKSLIPSQLSWKEWREGGLRKIRDAVQIHLGASGLHDLRAGYACERYKSLTGFDSPLLGGPRPDKKIDQKARLQIAKELGHGRVQISNAYIGGQK